MLHFSFNICFLNMLKNTSTHVKNISFLYLLQQGIEMNI